MSVFGRELGWAACVESSRGRRAGHVREVPGHSHQKEEGYVGASRELGICRAQRRKGRVPSMAGSHRDERQLGGAGFGITAVQTAFRLDWSPGARDSTE